MVNFIKDILLSPFGSFASVFSLFVLAFWLTHWITKRATDTVKSRLNNRMDKVEQKIDDIRSDFSCLRGTIEMIISGKFAKSKSPVSLTDEGIEMSKTLKAEETINRNWSRIYKNIEENICNKNPYDIQEYIKKTAAVEPEKFFSEDDLLNIKNFAFLQGQSIFYYSIIYALIIRDKYLKIKGIDIFDVDKYAPAQ